MIAHPDRFVLQPLTSQLDGICVGPDRATVIVDRAAVGRVPCRQSLRTPPVPVRHQGQPSPRFRHLRAARRDLGALLEAGREIVAADGNRSPAYQAAKRALDIAGAVTLLVCFAPVMLVVWAVLMVTTRGKPIFGQVRLGECGRPFVMYKFRTMVLDAERLQASVANEKDGPIFKNRQDPRITRVGRLLRSTSLDELPQLVNVLLGQMSLVGPRPPLAKEVLRYQPWQQRRLAVKPGLTCLWQVSGRSEVRFDDWVRMDLWYLRRQSLWVDLRLLVKTPAAVLFGGGAY